MKKLKGKNRFGGGNVNSLYVPMSETEQEVIARLIEADDLEIVVVGWGVVNKPKVIVGDLRVSFQFRLTFNAPVNPIPVYYFDLRLQTRAGEPIFQNRQSVMYGNNPMMIGAGVFLDMAWDIAIQNMNPAFVKRVMPKAIGLTSRVLDKDTQAPSLRGNMNLGTSDLEMLAKIRSAEQKLKSDDAKTNLVLTDKAKKAGYQE